MVSVFIGVGSNLENPIEQVQRAVDALASLSSTSLVQASSLYHSQPLGPQDQPAYTNAVAQLETTLPPLDLLKALQQLEANQGRVRDGMRWGSRVIDLDMLLYGNEVIHLEQLTVPHPGLKEREFVLYPLAEMVPELILPCGGRIDLLKAQCPDRGIRKLTVTMGEMNHG